MLFVCNSLGEQIGNGVIATISLCLGGGLLWASRTSKIKVMRFGFHLVRGKEAKLASAIFAVWFLLVGVVVLIATLFHLEC